MANVNNKKIDDGNEISKLIRLVVIVTIIFLSFYLLTFFLNKDVKKENSVKNQIQYDEILVGNILNQPNDDYYVIVYDEDSQNVLYDAYINQYKQSKDALRIYNAKLNNPLNSYFKADESFFAITKIQDLRLKGTTLIKISKGNIVEHYENENIISHLTEITKK